MGARRETRDALQALGQRPRRSRGQHFLCDPNVARRIVDAAGLEPSDAVLEIGPGLGALTDALADRAGDVRLVEVDVGLADRLRERYRDRSQVRVIRADVLACDLETLWGDVGRSGVVVSNLPYNISTPVLFRLLEWAAAFPRAVVMVQREVALRLVAPPGTRTRGVLSVLLQARGVVRACFDVGAGSFHPPPKVRSTVVEVRWLPVPPVPDDEWDTFRRVVRAAFGQRRKMLRSALRSLVSDGSAHSSVVDRALGEAGIEPTTRAERLSVDEFRRLARAFGSA